jgi:predicted transcriptional regulator of viral defense system
MKSKINLLEQLKPLPHFSKATIYQLGIQLGLKETTLKTYVSRFLKYKEILQLKKGLYVSNDFFDKNHGDISYVFYLANILRQPSYISSWAALQYYNLATEAIYSITSVTPKVTRSYRQKLVILLISQSKKTCSRTFYWLTINSNSLSPRQLKPCLIYYTSEPISFAA